MTRRAREALRPLRGTAHAWPRSLWPVAASPAAAARPYAAVPSAMAPSKLWCEQPSCWQRLLRALGECVLSSFVTMHT
jgi:hypothetical protein